MCLSSKNFQIRLNARNILKCLQKIKNSFVGVTLQSINTTGTGLTSHGQDLPFSSRRQHEILYNKGSRQGQKEIFSYTNDQFSTSIYTVQNKYAGTFTRTTVLAFMYLHVQVYHRQIYTYVQQFQALYSLL